MSRLADKVVIVTGGTRGMGEAIARACVAEGARVVIGGRDGAAGRSIAASLDDRAIYMPMDVADERDWERVVSGTLERFGAITSLVNNAGRPELSAIENISADTAEAVFRVNQLGPLLGMKHVVGPMRAAGGGSIINIGSVSFVKAIPQQAVYGATKGAIVGMSRSASAELAPGNIRVNVIHPGFFDTKLLHDASGGQGLAMGAQMVPLGRTAATREIVGAALYLLSDESSYVTGAELRVDGGFGIS
ncbi:SDR family NAD(P)-dependent oxidoreductase [Sphingobium sp. EM0848]|uniref:SDR family NAD(P)-dependent oxidoreductase n=1 Tax=Sphingobium sp. EM0848 TaxID=2743473 RepID=UPI00159C7ECB|nr:glucose 1-dehydrogenase [Sphingobium sp. EM0848]